MNNGPQDRLHELIWKGIYYQTTEYCRFTRNNGILIEGDIVGVVNHQPGSLSYRVELDETYQTRTVWIQADKQQPALFDLVRHTDGWRDQEGRHLPEFDECIDVDITLTPATNTLPIKRLSFELNVPVTLQVLYINPCGAHAYCECAAVHAAR